MTQEKARTQFCLAFTPYHSTMISLVVFLQVKDLVKNGGEADKIFGRNEKKWLTSPFLVDFSRRNEPSLDRPRGGSLLPHPHRRPVCVLN